MSPLPPPTRIAISADQALLDRWAAERQARRLTSAQLLALALDALASTDGGAALRHAAREVDEHRRRADALRDERDSARAEAGALRGQLRRDADDAIDVGAPLAPALDALWRATHLPQLLLWRHDDAWLPDDHWPAHHRLVIHGARRRLAQLETHPTAAAALAFSRVVQGDLVPLLLSESTLSSAVLPYQSPWKAHASLPPQIVDAVIQARALRGMAPELDPYGAPVAPPTE